MSFFLDSYRVNFKEDLKNLKFIKREEESLVRMHSFQYSVSHTVSCALKGSI